MWECVSKTVPAPAFVRSPTLIHPLLGPLGGFVAARTSEELGEPDSGGLIPFYEAFHAKVPQLEQARAIQPKIGALRIFVWILEP